MPLSVTDGGNSQKSFERVTLPVAQKKGIGVIAMKTLGAGAILQKKAASVNECLSYVWTLPVSTAILGCDQMDHIANDAQLARTAKPLSTAAMDRLRRRFANIELAALEPWKAGRIAADDPGGYRAD